MSRFNQLDEHTALPFQTSPLLQSDVPRLSRVFLVIEQHFLAQDGWNRIFHKGSLTLQRGNHPEQVVKIFVDYGNKLAGKCGVEIHENPVVIALELTGQPAIARALLRDGLVRMFHHYVDPRVDGNSKWWLQPIESHSYDILFLESGSCEFELDGRELEELIVEIGQTLEQL